MEKDETVAKRVRTHRTQGRSWLSIGVALFCLLALPIGLTATAEGQQSTRAKTLSPLQQGLNFYRGKVVTFIAPSAPGGGTDIWTRLLAPYMGEFLHAQVNVVDIPAGDTIAGQDTLAAANPDGLTFGWINPLIDVEIALSNTPGLNFNPVHEAFIGATEPNTSVWTSNVSPNCPYTTWQSMFHTAAPVTELVETVGISDMFTRVANFAFNINARVIGGYLSTANQIAGFTRGDGCLMDTPLSSIGQLIVGGRARPLAIIQPPAPGGAYDAYLAGVPTINQIIKRFGPQFKTKTERTAQTAIDALTADNDTVVAAPSAIKSYKLEALRAAMKWAARNPSLQSQALLAGDNPGFIPGTVAKAIYVDGLKYGKPIASELG